MVKRFLYIAVLLLLASCNTSYDMLITQAIPSYIRKGARIVTYCSPATESQHFLIFEYGDALYINDFEKDKPVALLMNGSSRFDVIDYSPLIDNESYKVVVQAKSMGTAPLSDILGCGLNNVRFTHSKDPDSFFMSTNNGLFLFSMSHPERLIRLESDLMQYDGDSIIIDMTGDLREYIWEDPVPYISYYLEKQPYRVKTVFDLAGNCVSVRDFSYMGCVLQNPMFIDALLQDIRSAIDNKYEARMAREKEQRLANLTEIARSNAVYISELTRMIEDDELDNSLPVPFKCRFTDIEISDRPDYQFRVVSDLGYGSIVYLYTNDNNFENVSYPESLTVFGKLSSRSDGSLQNAESIYVFDDGIFIEYVN